jgi:hypothetical protein
LTPRHLLLSALSVAAALVTFGATAVASDARSTTPSPAGYDVSYPQCGTTLPSGGVIAVVGVTNGLPYSSNPCLASEYRWAAKKSKPAEFYMNTANPETASRYWSTRAGQGPRPCSTSDLSNPANLNCAYNYGWNSASDALQRAAAATSTTVATSHPWWLDVEEANSWNGTTAANAQDLQGSVDYFRSRGVPRVGFYSTGYQWGQITGGAHFAATTSQPAPANWLAGLSDVRDAAAHCNAASSFSGGRVTLTQYPSGGFDGDYVC